jgi:aldehyde:ferredoxin oxidoreductase
VIRGQAAKPVYLCIRDGDVRLRDALALWGQDIYTTAARVRRDVGDPAAQVVCVGPAGEKRVVYASIMSPIGNAAARTGLGAVMGGKNLKAVVVRGTRGIATARPREFLAGCRKAREAIAQSRWYAELHQWGLTTIHDREMRGLYEVMGRKWDGAEAIREQEFAQRHLVNRVGCFGCPVACFDSYDIPGIGAGCMKCSPPGDLTWDLRNPDLMVFWEAMVICQRYGLDARSLSNMLAWLMELQEQGIITPAETDGISMEWGRAEAIVALARKVSLREGIGELLADGLPAAARKIGRGSEQYLLMAKGSPSDMHLAPIKSRALAAAVSAVGEDAQVQPALDYASARKYLRASDEAAFQEAIRRYKDMAEQQTGIREAPDPRTTEGKAALVRADEERTDIFDMTGVCTWMASFTGLPVDAEAIAPVLSLGLGREVTLADLKRASFTMRQLERAFAARLGFGRDDDRLSPAYFTRMRQSEDVKRQIGFTAADLERMKDDYYALLGWDVRTGVPKRETLAACGLTDVADTLGL